MDNANEGLVNRALYKQIKFEIWGASCSMNVR